MSPSRRAVRVVLAACLALASLTCGGDTITRPDNSSPAFATAGTPATIKINRQPPASALDSEVEGAIQEQLHNLMQGKTVIAIAHRLSTIAAMDRLVVMDEGRVAETGTHAELIARGGLYAELWARQSGGFLAREVAAE